MALSKIQSDSIVANAITTATLSDSGVTAGSYGNTTAIPVITVDAKGRITSATTNSVSGVTGVSFASANNTLTVSTSTTDFSANINASLDTVYSNAVAYAASNTYVNSTFAPLAGATFTGNVIANNINTNGSVQIDGDLTVSGNTVTIGVTNLAVEDNMIYLNDGSTTAHPDLGITGNYNDGSYKHAGFFRDATDARWKAFDGYTPEPNGAFIDTSNTSFRIADIQANTLYAANGVFTGGVSGITTLAAGNTTITGTAIVSSNVISQVQNGYAFIASSGSNTAYTGFVLQQTGDKGFLGVSGASGHWVDQSVAGDISLRSQNNLLLAAGGSSARVFVAANGNVGISNTTPTYKLSVNGTTRLTGSTFGHHFISFDDGKSPFSYYGAQQIVTGDVGSTQKAWRHGTRYSSGYTDYVYEYSTNDQSYGSDPSSLSFSEVLRIKGGGSSGALVATAVQQSAGWMAKTIVSSPASNGSFIFADRANTTTGEAGFGWSTGGTNKWIAFMPTSSDDLRFYQGSSSTVTFAANGKVGIGTTTPLSSLQLNAGNMSSANNTDMLPSALLSLSGGGGDYLSIGQYSNSNFWMQGGYSNPSLAYYNLTLQPLGGKVGVRTDPTSVALDVGGGMKLRNQHGRTSFTYYNIFGTATGSGSTQYMHIKTNITMVNIMYRFDAIGYNYGTSAAIMTSSGGYAYAGGNSIIAQFDTQWGGSATSTTYKSSDGYVVFRVYVGSGSYYAGFHVNAQFDQPTGETMELAILDSAWSSSSSYY